MDRWNLKRKRNRLRHNFELIEILKTDPDQNGLDFKQIKKLFPTTWKDVLPLMVMDEQDKWTIQYKELQRLLIKHALDRLPRHHMEMFDGQYWKYQPNLIDNITDMWFFIHDESGKIRHIVFMFGWLRDASYED